MGTSQEQVAFNSHLTNTWMITGTHGVGGVQYGRPAGSSVFKAEINLELGSRPICVFVYLVEEFEFLSSGQKVFIRVLNRVGYYLHLRKPLVALGGGQEGARVGTWTRKLSEGCLAVKQHPRSHPAPNPCCCTIEGLRKPLQGLGPEVHPESGKAPTSALRGGGLAPPTAPGLWRPLVADAGQGLRPRTASPRSPQELPELGRLGPAAVCGREKGVPGSWEGGVRALGVGVAPRSRAWGRGLAGGAGPLRRVQAPLRPPLQGPRSGGADVRKDGGALVATRAVQKSEVAGLRHLG